MAPIISGVNFGVGDESFVLGGATRPADFPTQMRLLAAYLTDPAWRPTAWNRARSISKTMHDMMNATPQGVAGRDLGVLLASGDGRWRTLTSEEIASGRVEDARALLEDAFSDGPLEVIIVGDVTVEEAIAQTAATFGALKPRGPAMSPAAEARKRFFPAPVAAPVILTHKGRADQALGFIAWPTADFHSDPDRARALGLLSQVLQLRLTEEVREKQGAAYSPSSGASHSTTFPGYGYMSAPVQAPPKKLAGFFADAQKIADSLAAAPPTADRRRTRPRPPPAHRLHHSGARLIEPVVDVGSRGHPDRPAGAGKFDDPPSQNRSRHAGRSAAPGASVPAVRQIVETGRRAGRQARCWDATKTALTPRHALIVGRANVPRGERH